MFCAVERSRSSARRAFTLVELLVVVAIIAMLVSILLPTLGQARAMARMVKCLTNMHTIGRGSSLYAADNNDYVPRDASWGARSQNGWYLFASRFSPYLGGPKIPLTSECEDNDNYLHGVFMQMPVYHCPCFQDRQFALTYISNGWNFREPTNWGSPPSNLSELTRPAGEVGYICELNPDVVQPRTPFGMYDFLGRIGGGGGLETNCATFEENGEPNPFPRMIRYDDMRHSGRTAIVFFDGHAESRWITPKEMPAQLFFPY